jgi:predicted outer membrane repeat protein
VLANNSSVSKGGGIYTDSALTLENCTVTNNFVSRTECKGEGLHLKEAS